MIKRVNVVDVGSVKIISGSFQAGGVYRDQVDNINFRDHEPIGAGYVAAWLKHRGFDAKLIWPRSDTMSAEEVLAGNPQVVCFSSLTFNFPKTQELARKIRLVRPEIILIIGGYHATCAPGEVSAEIFNGKLLFDFVVVGEGELSIHGILRYLNSQIIREDVEGVVYHNGELWANKLYRFDPRLNSIPDRPREKMLQSRRYGLYYPAPSQQQGVTLFVWSRGCPFNCPFCSSKTMFPTCKDQPAVMFRDIDNVVDEIKFCQREYGTNFGFSVDLNAPGTVGNGEHGKAWLRKLCREIGETGLKWYAMCRLDADQEDFAILGEGGCTQIGFGIESYIDHRKSGTKLSLEEWKALAQNVALKLQNLKIMSKFYYIFGGLIDGRPYTVDDIYREGKEILDVECDTMRISWMAYPINTPEFKWLREVGLLEGDGRDYSLMSTEYPIIKVLGRTADELQTIRTEIMARFFSPERYGPHARAQIARVPEWEQSFLEFDEILRRQFGRGWSE